MGAYTTEMFAHSKAIQGSKMTNRRLVIFALCLGVASIVLGSLISWHGDPAVSARTPNMDSRAEQRSMPGVHLDEAEPSGEEKAPNIQHRELVAAPRADNFNQDGIDWQTVGELDPIPRAMPARESDDAYGAGFAREWVERSLGTRTTAYLAYGGWPMFDPKPPILQIVSEPKKHDDSWAYGVEYELRQLIAARPELIGKPVVSRVFCNAHGCLIYTEYLPEQPFKLAAVLKAIDDSPWSNLYGIHGENMFLLSGTQRADSSPWILSVVNRHLRSKAVQD